MDTTPTPTNAPPAETDDCLGPLKSLYQLTGGNQWHDASGWTGWQYPGDCCIANGVTCNRDSRVIFLNLTRNNLAGYLPEDVLGSMTHLLSLTITHNPKLTGFIPEDLPNLPSLYRLDLSYNALNGEVPNSFCNILSPNLQHLYLNNNNLSGPMPPLGGPGIDNNFVVDNSSCSFQKNPFTCIDPANSNISCAFDVKTPICTFSLATSAAASSLSTGTSRPTVTPSISSSGLSTNSMIGLGVGSALAFVMCIIAAGFISNCRKKWAARKFSNFDHPPYRRYNRWENGSTNSDLGIMDESGRDGSSFENGGDAASLVMFESPFLRRWWEQPLLVDSVTIKKNDFVQGMTYRVAVDFRPNTPGTDTRSDDIRLRPEDLVVIESVSDDGEFCTGWNITSKTKGRFPTACLSSEIVKTPAIPLNRNPYNDVALSIGPGVGSITRSGDTEATIWNRGDEMMDLRKNMGGKGVKSLIGSVPSWPESTLRTFPTSELEKRSVDLSDVNATYL